MAKLCLSLVLLVLVLHPGVNGLHGYDCQQPGINSRAISLVDIGECKSTVKTTQKKDEWGQIIQLSTTTSLEVTNCRVMKSVFIKRCGMHSHQMDAGGPFLNEPVRITLDTCKSMISTKEYHPTSRVVIKGLVLNSVTRTTVTEEGVSNADGSCEGYTISYRGQTYHSAFMKVHYEVFISQQKGRVEIDSNSIYMSSGLRCDHDVGSCFDSIDGLYTWLPYSGDCKNKHPSVLYEGQVTTIEEDDDVSLIHVNFHEFLFVSRINGRTYICGRQMLTTDYQNIMILLFSTMNPRLQSAPIARDQVNPVLYTNAKLSYLQYKTVNDINMIYHDVIHQLCDLEIKVLENTLNIIKTGGDGITSSTILGGPGHIINIRGEAAYITQCPIREVTLRSGSKCYGGLPITYQNRSMFLMPITRLIVTDVAEVPCSIINPPLYKIGETWISVSPNYIKSHNPEILSPVVKVKKTPEYIGDFAKGGIYSPQDMENFYKSLTHGSTREAALDHIVQSIVNEQPMKYNIMAAVSDKGWAAIAKNHLRAIWGNFIIFGEFMSGVIGLYLIYMIITKLGGMMIRAIALHRVYGCSWKLLGAVWSAISFFFMTITKHSDDEEEQSRQPTSSGLVMDTSRPHNTPIRDMYGDAQVTDRLYPSHQDVQSTFT